MSILRDYLSSARVNRKDFADRIGVHQSVLSRFCSELARPGLDTAFAIERETEGQVPAAYWLTVKPGQAARAEAEATAPDQPEPPEPKEAA